MEEEIKLNFDSWKPSIKERTRNRMKLQVKLNKEEAQAFRNFLEMVKPPEVSEDDFLKGIFKIGVETMEEKLMAALHEHAEKNDIDLEQAMKEVEEEAETETEEGADEVQSD